MPATLQTSRQLQEINRILYAKYGDCRCSLNHLNAFQLLVAVILSAQCTDKRVNEVTVNLFRKFPDVKSFATADRNELEQAIMSAGLFRNKAKSIIGASQALLERFSGEVPKTMEALTSLPGVGRKTANVILGDAFEIPGFAVDTHVNRLLNRLGVVKSEVPEKIEAVVNGLLEARYWTNFSHMLILHGRETCHARTPDCEVCILRQHCKYYRNKQL